MSASPERGGGSFPGRRAQYMAWLTPPLEERRGIHIPPPHARAPLPLGFPWEVRVHCTGHMHMRMCMWTAHPDSTGHMQCLAPRRAHIARPPPSRALGRRPVRSTTTCSSRPCSGSPTSTTQVASTSTSSFTRNGASRNSWNPDPNPEPQTPNPKRLTLNAQPQPLTPNPNP